MASSASPTPSPRIRTPSSLLTCPPTTAPSPSTTPASDSSTQAPRRTSAPPESPSSSSATTSSAAPGPPRRPTVLSTTRCQRRRDLAYRHRRAKVGPASTCVAYPCRTLAAVVGLTQPGPPPPPGSPRWFANVWSAKHLETSACID
ncbi:putative phosphoserine aminotransferase 1, chloroplastic [Iris pallida]|uniref:Phosphoserine aminotransferase 1, chloroplastic n=1 Tax=Iris pallida TaxID=29817 RepID=A0AAX6HDN0_IRIPA|nr:putative phosphoserine aminotransferase 1, chloroplastic [Iris pallida]